MLSFPIRLWLCPTGLKFQKWSGELQSVAVWVWEKGRQKTYRQTFATCVVSQHSPYSFIDLNENNVSFVSKIMAILRKRYTLIVKRNNKYVLPPSSFFYFEMEWAQKSITATAASNTTRTHVTMPSRILKTWRPCLSSKTHLLLQKWMLFCYHFLILDIRVARDSVGYLWKIEST